jgi:transcriptional regulator with XRE-family HTH domain
MSQKKYHSNQKLREARELRGWSQEDVAEQLGEFVDKSTVSRWERGVAIPQPHYRRKLATCEIAGHKFGNPPFLARD